MPLEAEQHAVLSESACCFIGICIKHMEMPRLKRRYVSPDVLVIDDFANTRMSEDDALQIFKVMEYRYGFKTTIIASQLEPAEWHNNFGASQLQIPL
ncbi:MAG: ATP-binding protein [Clostridiales bacterium]|nr:ATP-binding protein [Clostridiales bacterium]